ncbi:hypothetical protein [Rhodococcus koreensis]|uniref:hypothetical protein n=1 Tax=Rhodococcus koreensis TaxID=99653 RepID=UPI0036DCAFFA
MVNVNNSYVATPPIDGGVLHSADLGTTLPATAKEELNALFKANDHGAVGENGIGIQRTRTTTDIKAFGGKTFRTVQTESDEAIVITLLEDDNLAVLETVNGADNVVVHEPDEDGLAKTIYHVSDALPIKSWIVDTKDGDKLKRYVIEKGQVTEIAEITDVHTDVTKVQITIKTYESSIGNKGQNVVELRLDASQAVTGP